METATVFGTKLNNLMNKGLFCDLTLKIQKDELSAHKLVLVEKSEHFMELLQKDPHKKIIEIVNYEPSIIREMLNHFYGRETSITIWNCLKIYKAAREFKVPDLMQSCITSMSSAISVPYVFDILKLSKDFPEADVQNKCHSFIEMNFDELSLGKNWRKFLENLPLVKGFVMSLNIKEVPRFKELYSDLVLDDPTKKLIKFNDTLKKMLETKVFVDITLITSDKKKIEAHKAVLASRSEVFKDLFMSTDPKADRFPLKNMDFQTLHPLIHFIYCDELLDPSKITPKLMLAADGFALSDLRDACEFQLFNNIDEKNVIEILIAGHKSPSIHPFMKQKCKGFLMMSIDKIQEKDWKELTGNHLELVTEIIKDMLILKSK